MSILHAIFITLSLLKRISSCDLRRSHSVDIQDNDSKWKESFERLAVDYQVPASPRELGTAAPRNPAAPSATGDRPRIKAVINVGRVELEMQRYLPEIRSIQPLAVLKADPPPPPPPLATMLHDPICKQVTYICFFVK